MALPFILGVAVGAGVVYAVNKNEKAKEKVVKVSQKVKDIACDVKDNASATIDCIKEKAQEKTSIKQKDIEDDK